MKKKYRFLILVLTFFITFNVLFTPQHANCIEPLSTTIVAPLLGIPAGPVLAIAGFLVGCGVVWKNREQIITTCNSLKQKMISSGVEFAISNLGAFALDNKSKSFLLQEIKKPSFALDLNKLSGSMDIDYNFNFVVPNGFSATLTYYNMGWSPISFGSGTSVSYEVYAQNKNSWITYTPINSKPKDIQSGSTCTNLSVTVQNAQSVCVDNDLKFDSTNKSIDSDRVLDFTKTPTTMADVDSLVGCKDVNNLPFVRQKAADEVINNPIDKPIDPPIDKPIDPPVVKPTTWEWLKDLLSKILDAIKSIPSVLQDILDWLESIPAWFVVDWNVVLSHADYGSIVSTKLKPFYQTAELLQNIKVNPQSHSGKFYMLIPKEMGGDNKEHCVLDLSFGDIYFKTARTLIKAGMWVAFLFWIIKLFKPKFTIGG